MIIIKERHCEELSGIFTEIPRQSLICFHVSIKRLPRKYAEFFQFKSIYTQAYFLTMTLHKQNLLFFLRVTYKCQGLAIR
jgi:hypothetical protein